MRYVGLVLILLIGLTGCGDNIVEIGGLSGSGRPGRVSLMNNWTSTVWAEYIDPDGNTVRTTILAGETEVVSGDDILDGGGETYFFLEFDYDWEVRKRVKVIVDGNVLMIIHAVRGQGDVLGENFEIVSTR